MCLLSNPYTSPPMPCVLFLRTAPRDSVDLFSRHGQVRAKQRPTIPVFHRPVAPSFLGRIPPATVFFPLASSVFRSSSSPQSIDTCPPYLPEISHRVGEVSEGRGPVNRGDILAGKGTPRCHDRTVEVRRRACDGRCLRICSAVHVYPTHPRCRDGNARVHVASHPSFLSTTKPPSSARLT